MTKEKKIIAAIVGFIFITVAILFIARYAYDTRDKEAVAPNPHPQLGGVEEVSVSPNGKETNADLKDVITMPDVTVDKTEVQPEKEEVALPAKKTVEIDVKAGAVIAQSAVVVGFYSIEKTNNEYIRYLSFACNRDTNLPIRYNTGSFFLLGREVAGIARIPVRNIVVNDEMYDATNPDHFESIVRGINQHNKMRVVLESNDEIVMTLKNRKGNEMPCLPNLK